MWLELSIWNKTVEECITSPTVLSARVTSCVHTARHPNTNNQPQTNRLRTHNVVTNQPHFRHYVQTKLLVPVPVSSYQLIAPQTQRVLESKAFPYRYRTRYRSASANAGPAATAAHNTVRLLSVLHSCTGCSNRDCTVVYGRHKALLVRHGMLAAVC